ncbi:MAG: hypothetical protein ACREH4_05890 [Vitreimonas sp.]
MNALQALAVAAAALAISGDPWGSTLTRAEARLTSFLAHAEVAADEFVTATAEGLREDRCEERQYSNAPFGKTKHRLPDTSIHSAAGAARL